MSLSLLRRALPRSCVRWMSTEQSDDIDEEKASDLLERFLSTEPALLKEKEPQPEETTEEPATPSPLMDRPPVFPEIEGESEVDREIRAHNTSFSHLKEQTILGRVVAVRKKEVLVDLGWKNYQTFLKSELVLSQIYRDSSMRDPEQREEEGHHFFQKGDELRFRIEELQTPYGEMFVSTQRMRKEIRRNLVWDELQTAFIENKMVTGRVLNPCNAGYAIGIAGFVAFCPLLRISPVVERKIGILQPFEITGMSEVVGRNLVVVDPNVKMVGRPRQF